MRSEEISHDAASQATPTRAFNPFFMSKYAIKRELRSEAVRDKSCTDYHLIKARMT